ncbi:MAG: aminopeptidase [Polyangiales bacterium]
MTKIKQLGLVMVALAASASTGVAQPTQPGAKPNFVEIADRVVGKTLNIKEGEIVQVSGAPSDAPFLEEIAIAVRKRGAWPIVTMWSESAEKNFIANVPATFDTKINAADLALAKIVNAVIIVPAVRDNSIYATFAPERMQAMRKAGESVAATTRKRNVRTVELGNGVLPSAARAKALGISEAELTSLYWAGVSADYAAIETKAKALQDMLAKAKELHITHPNGTDLKIKIKARKVLSSDGVVSDADRKAGGPGVQAWLPAGEVYFALDGNSTEGKLVDDHFYLFEREAVGVTAEIKGGKITSIVAKSGWDGDIKKHYDAAGPGKNTIGLIDFGINPAVKSSGKMETYMGAGMVTIGAGLNLWAGGTIAEPLGLTFMLPGTTVTVDGVTLVDGGALK